MKPLPETISSLPSTVAEEPVSRTGSGRVSPHYFAELLDQLPDAVICVDRSWQITFANAEATRLDHLTGIETSPRQSFWDRYPDLVGSDLERRYRATMTKRVADHLEYFYEPSGVWVEVHVFPTSDGIAIYFHHITARKLAEISRDEAVRKLQQVFESAPDSIVCIDRNWNCSFANRAARTILKTEDLVGANLWTAFPLNQQEPFASNYRTTMERGIPTEFEAFYPAPLNVWFKVVARPYEGGVIIFSSDITARKKAEARRDAITRQLQQVFDATTDAIVGISRDWTITLVNRRAGELLAVKGDLIGRNHWEEFPAAAQSETFRFHYHQAMEKQVAGEFEVFYPEPFHRWFNISVRPSDDGIVLFFRDITEERAGRLALLEQQETLAFVQQKAGVATWIIDLATRVMTFSDGSYPVFGRPCAEITSIDDWEAIIHPDYLVRVREATERTITSGQVVTVDYQVVAPDGSRLWVESRRIPVYNQAGVATHVRGVTHVITDRKRSEEKLAAFAVELQKRQVETERQHAELETIYSTAPIGLALFDPVEFRYLRLNDRQAAFFGLTPAEIVGKTLTEMAPIEGLREMFEQVAMGRPVINQLLEGRLATDADGVHRYWTVNYFPVYGSDGSIEAISAASLEITHQKKAETALIQSEKLAAVGRLASSISHEINNPLEAITNILYLIDRDDSLGPDVKTLVGMAQSELSRVCQIATQTLRFHRQAVRATHVTAESLVSAVLNLYQGRLANSGIRVEAIYSTAVPILCFENDIRQVLNNLIANAIDAMRQNGGRLIVRAHDVTPQSELVTEPPSGGVRGVRITIADTGHGMTPEVRARIFEPFFTTKDLNGTGLGLWISDGIVNRHKGRLTLRTSTHPVHHGTIFALTLPIEDRPTHGAS